MASELLHLLNFEDALYVWSDKTIYKGFAGSTPATLYQIGMPQYCKACSGKTSQLAAFGEYYGTTSIIVRVKITASTTFQFSMDNGVTWSTDRTISTGRNVLTNGLAIQFYETTGFTIGDNWAFLVYPAYFNSPGTYNRWSVAKWRDGYFFSNLLNPIRFVNAKNVVSLGSNCDIIPSAKYLELFHEHLVAANIIYNGEQLKSRVAFSDLHDMSNFAPTQFNEADFYDLALDENLTERVSGITGIKKLGQKCIVYGPKQIFEMTYVGLPRVMQLLEIFSEVGSAFPHGLVGNNKFHCFPSDENFYVFDGENAPKAVGDAIKEFFFADLSTTALYRYKLWGYIDRLHQEVHWVYCSTVSTGDFDKEVVWNYREDTWASKTCENVHSYVEGTLRGLTTPIDSDTRHIDDATELIEDSGVDMTMTRIVLYGTSDLKLLRDELPADSINDLLAQEVPYLETKDIYYDDLESVKEINSMLINAGYDTNCSGVEVYCSARARVDDTVVYEKASQVWTSSLLEGVLSLPRLAGKVFRFKFVFKEAVTGKGVRNTVFSAWGENVRGLPIPNQPGKMEH